jgi:hypothetical protein
VRGKRRRRHQVIPCPSCGQPVFVLPRSAFPDRRPGPPAAARKRPRAGLAAWRGPLIAAGATLLVLALGFLLLLPYLNRRPPLDLKARLDTARRALAEGSFQRALDELNAASRDAARADAVPPDERRQLERLHRQARLLDDLLNQPLQDLLRQAAASRFESEWQRRFARDYKGRAVLFDDEVGLDDDGRPQLRNYVVQVGGERARPALEDLHVLRALPLVPARRLVFGARLASFVRDDAGNWAIGFEPDSGVLLTEPDLLASWRPGLVDDELRKVLGEQERWLRDLPP